MRTTVVLDDEIFREARRRALERSQTLSEYLNGLLRDALHAPHRQADEPPFMMPTFGPEHPQRSLEPAEIERIFEDEDSEARGHR